MGGALTYRPVSEADLPRVSRLLHHAFAGVEEMCGVWMRDAGLEHVRVMGEPGTDVPACLTRIPMGQYFGGRSVPMLGIAGVAVAPEARGGGIGRRLMEEAIRECARDGWALSGLYASTQSLYRQVGYEQAGHRFETRIAAHRVADRGGLPRVDADAAIVVQPLADAHEDAVRRCYAEFASSFDGMLDRGPYCWQRTRKLRDGTVSKGFGFVADGAVEGYVYLNQTRKPDTGHHDVGILDMAFSTPRGARATARVRSNFGTVADDVLFCGGPLHPLLALLPQQICQVTKRDFWMIRVVDVKRALEGRGYAPGVRGEVTLEVADRLVPSNHGRWTLSVAEGRGQVRAGGGDASVRLDIRSLGPIYSGLWTGRQAALLGLVSGDAAALDALAAIFGGGGTPWMIDMF
jgi:predicted acetyltransferase